MRRIGTLVSGSTRASQGMNAARNRANCSSFAAGICGARPGSARALAIAASIDPCTPAEFFVFGEGEPPLAAVIDVKPLECESEQRQRVGTLRVGDEPLG